MRTEAEQTNKTRHARGRISRIGSAYAIVLIMAGIISTVALGGMTLRRASIERSATTADATRALELAKSAVELGLHRVAMLDGDANPNSVAGVWINNQPLGPGTVTVSAIAPDTDALLSLNLLGIGINVGESQTPRILTIIGEGKVGNARRRLAVLVENVNIPEYRTRVVNAGAAAHWRLNEASLNSRAREIVSSDQGSYSNILVSGTLPTSMGGPAPNMQNRNNYVTLPGGSVHASSGAFALWLRRAPGAPDDAVALQHGYKSSTQYIIKFVGGVLTIEHTDINGKTFYVTGNPIEPSQWHHIVGTYGPEGIALYVNNRLVASEPSPSAGLNSNASAPILIGVGRDTAGGSTHSTLGGAVREVSVFQKTFTHAEISTIYADGQHQNSGSGWVFVADTWRPVVN